MLLNAFPALKKLDGRHGDVILGEDKVEIKTDFYDSTKTSNFFIERYSDMRVCSPGGPWQAQAHGCKYFVYQFLNCGSGWLFAVDALVPVLDKVIATIKPTEVKNVRWTTLGFKVPRVAIESQALLSWRLNTPKPGLIQLQQGYDALKAQDLVYKLLNAELEKDS